MTSLSLQLKRLALPQTDPNLFTRNEVASLLFEPKDAATMDRTTFYALGCTGLEELLGIEPSLSEFQQSLFSSSSLTLERSVQTKDINRKLDQDISLFLSRVCPYFLLRPTHKCLEWLIHRFHIHLYNVDSLVACILPYHDTKIFVRVIQLLKIHEATNKWNWLHCIQKPGVPLSRLTLVTHCHKDLGFMDFICNMVLSSIQAFSEQTGGSQLRIIFSFFASTMISALDSAPVVTDAIINKLLPYMNKGLRSSLVDFRACSLMLVCQLSVKVVMKKELVQSLSSVLCKSFKDPNPVLVRETLGALIVLLQNQNHTGPTEKALTRLSSLPGLVSSLEVMAQTHDMSPLLRHLLPHLLNCTFLSSDSSEASSAAADILQDLLRCVPLTSDLDLTLARQLLNLYLSQSAASDEDLLELNQRLLPVIRGLETKYNVSLDKTLSSCVSELSEEQKPLFHQLLSLSATSGKFQILGDSNSSLLLSLNHPQASVRVLALHKLKDIVSSGQGEAVDQDFLKTSVHERLKDDEPSVVSVALTLLQLLLDSLDTEETISALLSLLQKAQDSYSLDWCPVVSEAVRLLSLTAVGRSDMDSDRLIFMLLPFVVPSGTSDSVRLKLALSLSQSPVLEQHPLTAGWKTALESTLHSSSVQRSDKGPNQVLVSIQTLVSTLSTNLENMETFSRRDMLVSLCSCVELLSESDNSLDQTPLLVLLQTLVLGLRTLTDTHHLLTACRIYCVIQRLLLQSTGEAQEHGHPSTIGPTPSFWDWLGLYLCRCDRQMLSQVLVSILSQFIQGLQCPDETFKGEEWWNPEQLDSNTCCYLQLLAQVFSLLMGGALDGHFTVQYKHLVKLFLKVHLEDSLFLLRFLSLIWSHSGLHAEHGERRGKLPMRPVLQTQVLLMGKALIENYKSEQVKELVLKTPVFPSLLVVLSSPWREVRRAGLDVLLSLSGVAPFGLIAERLLCVVEEVAADSSYLSCALGALHSEQTRHKQEVGQAFLKLLENIQMPSCPSDTACVLLGTLSHVNGEDVLRSLLPAVERLLTQINPDAPPLLLDEARLLALLLGKFNSAAAPLLIKDSHCRDLFIRAMKTNHRPTEGPNIQITAVEQISKPFFLALNEEVQQLLLTTMFDLLVQSPSPQVAQSISSVFKQISLDAQLMASELSPPEKPTVIVSVQQTRRAKILQSRRAADSGEAQLGEGTVSWHRVTLILELLQHKKKLKRPQALVPPLFNLLQRRLESRAEEQASVEYTKQLLLSCLLSMFSKLSPDGTPIPADVLDPERLSVELVVQCIRSSEMAQTHHQALLLLSAVAPLYPEKVLLNIMPIFTFMGANILRLDDAYSFRVIDKTVQMVIPAIIKTQDWSGPDSSHMRALVTKVVHVFVDALPHVPEHRKVPVLTCLLTTIGAERVLWVLLALLFKQQSTATTTADKDPVVDRNWDLWVSVCCEFSVRVQIQSIVQVLVFLQQLPHDTDQASEKPQSRRTVKKPQQEKMEELIFNTDIHSSKELRHFKYISVSFCAHLLGSSSFIHQVLELGQGREEESLQQLQQKLLEEILRFIHTVAQCVEQNSDKPTAKYWRVLLNKSYELLDKVNALLPSDEFIAVTRGLMGNEVSNVRRKALELLNSKLQQKITWDPPQVTSLLSLLPDLQAVVTSSDEPAVNRQTALFSLKLLCRLFGASEPQSFVAVMRVAVGVVTAEEEDRNVMATALQCVAESIVALKVLTVPQLPSLVPAVLGALIHRKDCVSSEIYLLSSVTALHRLTETLPNFISPYLLDISTQVCRLTRLAEVSSLSPALVTRLDSLRSTLASKIPSRVLLPTVCKCYNRLVQDQKNQLVALMVLLEEHIGHMERDQLTLHQPELSSFFLSALDFRAAHCQDDLEKAEKIEGSVIQCLLSMVLKLSEVTFRPLFFKLLEWSKGSKDRLLTFCRLSDAVALRLKGLFVLFAGNLVKPFSDLLRQSQDIDAPLFPSEEKVSMLLRWVLDCLQKIFLFDTQRFLSRERAETLMGPLVDQLENLQGSEVKYRSRVSQSLVPCLGQFAVALADDTLWKNLNYQILLKTRHTEEKVRVSALAALLELCSKLRENYMVLLPETIPFLAELMEDECEEVEKEVQRVVQEMENVLGESLQSYF